MNKIARQEQILKLIRKRQLYTQEDLAQALAEEFKTAATQVTLSRDIRDLGLVKTQDGYRQMGSSGGAGTDLAGIAGEFLRNVRQAQNLIVLKTSPAHASSLAVAIDQEDDPEVVGTVAGDDTVLVISPDAAAATRFRERLLSYLRAAQ
jgi:transcriptional regulator of arginine metabolism